MKTGPKSEQEKEALIKQIQNLIISGEIHEKTITENADKIKISRYTFRNYLSIAYQQLDIQPEIIVKRVRDTRQCMLDILLRDFMQCEDPIQRSNLSKNISGLLDSQEKSATLMSQAIGEVSVITSGTGLWTKYLSKLPHNEEKEVITT